MIEQAAALSTEVGVSAACQAYGIPRSSYYAAQQPRERTAPTPPPRAPSRTEKAAVGQQTPHRTYRGKPGFKTIIKPSKKAQQRYLLKVKDVIRSHQGISQAALVAAINPVIRGWANYYHTCSAKNTFHNMDYQVYQKLYRWAAFRHRNKNAGWRYRRYWRQVKGIIAFSDGTSALVSHAQTRITRHTKVKGEKKPF
jgi:RNA-directed DNA polymerase